MYLVPSRPFEDWRKLPWIDMQVAHLPGRASSATCTLVFVHLWSESPAFSFHKSALLVTTSISIYLSIGFIHEICVWALKSHKLPQMLEPYLYWYGRGYFSYSTILISFHYLYNSNASWRCGFLGTCKLLFHRKFDLSSCMCTEWIFWFCGPVEFGNLATFFGLLARPVHWSKPN